MLKHKIKFADEYAGQEMTALIGTKELVFKRDAEPFLVTDQEWRTLEATGRFAHVEVVEVEDVAPVIDESVDATVAIEQHEDKKSDDVTVPEESANPQNSKGKKKNS